MIYVTHDQAEALSLGDRIVVMNRGVIQQMGDPEAVYQGPCNRFVAEFLGSPAMNFLEGRLHRDDGGLGFITGSWRLQVPAALAPRPGSCDQVVLGVRPEDVRLASRADAGALAMEVVLGETLGHEWLATLEHSGHRITARLPAHARVERRQTVNVVLDMKKAHWFDASSGVALGHEAPSG
jgi:multiple sugar transport system ATP-binding protein